MKIEAYIEEHAHHFVKALITEYKGDREAVAIIRKYMNGEKIDSSEEEVLKTQFFDSLKLAGVGIPFVLIPGASILMPILIKVAAKHHIALLPSAFDTPES
ncbi:MAG: hypothetical protein J7599_13920 [Niabella sp.]|nr:hypothetical protein [Niabella sp.]